jgi:folate-binding protein YgfZ
MTQDTSLDTEYWRVRETCAYFWMETWQIGAVEGEDAFSFLQTQTTNDCLAPKTGEGCANAIVTRKGNLRGTFTLYKTGDHEGFLLMERNQADQVIEALEEFHFREALTFTREVPGLCLLGLQGPKTPALINEATGQIHLDFKTSEIREISVQGHKVWALEKSLTGETGLVLAFEESARSQVFEAIEEAGKSTGFGPVSYEALETLRVEAGLPVFGLDMDEKMLLPETGLEHTAVSYHKGCYTGQEVIARLKTYGAPSFALMGITLEEGATEIQHNAEMKLGNKRLGVVKTGAYSPSLGRNIALAYIQKDYRSPDQVLEITVDGKPQKITTALLPFYQPVSNLTRAEELHGQAMEIYKKEDNLDRPIALLREAIALAPKFALGYEALGVLLSKQNKLDEAIALMKRLVEIDPGEIMAHSNLSVYYMQQGRIEEAEAEKGEATAIQFEKIIEEKQKEKALQAQSKEQEAERERQVGMFKQVLEIDPVDQVANFGLGTIFFEKGLYDEALGPLETVVANFKDYSAAYLALGKTLEKLARKDEAAEVYKKGIAAASKKGDLMPLRDMQNRLNKLSDTTTG